MEKKQQKDTNRKRNTTKKTIKEEQEVVEKKSIDKQKTVAVANKKTTFNLLEVIIIMIITAIFGILIGSGVVYFTGGKVIKGVSAGNGDLDELVSTYNQLLTDYYGKVDKEKLVEAGIKGMLEYLDDPYSTYMDVDTANTFNEEVEGSFVGMGVEISRQETGEVKIVTIFENSPAEKSGFKVGDIFVKVGDKDVDKLTTVEISKLIKGKIGTSVNITIKRDGKEKTIKLVRNKVDIPSVSSKVINYNKNKIGYIRIKIFAKNTADQFSKELKKLMSEKVDSLILDVRGNNGGYLTTVTEIASNFLTNKQAIYQLETKGVVRKVYATGSSKIDLDVAVLIDNGSASASEILAAALNENNKSLLIGTTTYGKGTVQKAYSLSSGATVKYTIQSWLTAKGNKIDRKGIKPTIEVKLSEKYAKDPKDENDNQLQTALKELSK